MITFAYIWLFLLLPLPLLVSRIFPAHHEPRSSLRVPFMARLEQLTGGRAEKGSGVRRSTRIQKIITYVVWILMVSALARPQWIGEAVTKIVASRDLLLAVDLSTSMDEKDFRAPDGTDIDRLTAVKLVVDDFLTRREGDRVGLILFGSAAFVQAPFTEDIDTCRTLLNEAETGMAGPKTMIGDAIGLAITVFEKSDLEEQVLILLTDGNDSGSRVPPENAARIARDYDITVHTIAMGTIETTGMNAIDEKTLKTVADITGGGFFRASNREELAAVYDRIDEMEPRKAEVLTQRPKSERFHWPLGAALVLILVFHLGGILGQSRKVEKSKLNGVEGLKGSGIKASDVDSYRP